MFERYREHLTKVLLVFVIFSIGFAFGKNSVKNPKSGETSRVVAGQESKGTGESKVKIFYMHARFRCVTCNNIEESARALTKKEFAEELAAKTIVWEDVNFQKNKALAEKFDVVASCVVVCVVRNGKVESFERLDKVWTLLEKPDEFNSYVRNAIKKALNEL